MRTIAKALFKGPFTANFEPLNGVLVITPAGALQGLGREKEGCEEAVEEMVDHIADHADTLEIPADLGTKAATLTQQIEQVRDLKAWAEDLVRATTSTEVLLEDKREALIKKVVTAVRTTAHREDPGLLALFEKTLRYYGQVGEQAAKTRAENAAAAAAEAEAEAEGDEEAAGAADSGPASKAA